MANDEEEDTGSAPKEDVVAASDGEHSVSGGTDQDAESQSQTNAENQSQTTDQEKASLQMSEDALALQQELASIKVVAPDISV